MAKVMQGATYSQPFPEAPAGARARTTPLLSVLFMLFTVFAVLRVALGSLVLDLFVSYTTDSGPIYEKLHPSFYGFVFVAAVALTNLRIVLTPWEVRVVRALLAFNAGIVVILLTTALMGRGGSTGFMIDSYCATSFVVLLFLFPTAWRPHVGQAILLWLAFNSLIAMVEYGGKFRFLPFNEDESAFRPIALTSHPLELGLCLAIGPAFTAATRWSMKVKIAVTMVFLAGLAVTGARTALVFGSFSACLVALGAIGGRVNAQRRLAQRLIAVTALVALIPLAILALAATGGLDRFMTSGSDANAQSRISIYGVFYYMSWSQLLWGMDPAILKSMAKNYFKLEAVESSLVMFVTLFGWIGTILFLSLFGYVVRVLLIGAKASVVLGTIVFFLIIASSNGLSSKGSGVIMLFLLIASLRPEPRSPAWP